jgi:predicted RNA-binding protein YlxR (DUF448 family)
MESGQRHPKVPVRTCISCRRRAEQSELRRISSHGMGLSLCSGSRGTGRGAYVHLLPECVSKLDPERVRRALRLGAEVLVREGLVEIRKVLLASGLRR